MAQHSRAVQGLHDRVKAHAAEGLPVPSNAVDQPSEHQDERHRVKSHHYPSHLLDPGPSPAPPPSLYAPQNETHRRHSPYGEKAFRNYSEQRGVSRGGHAHQRTAALQSADGTATQYSSDAGWSSLKKPSGDVRTGTSNWQTYSAAPSLYISHTAKNLPDRAVRKHSPQSLSMIRVVEPLYRAVSHLSDRKESLDSKHRSTSPQGDRGHFLSDTVQDTAAKAFFDRPDHATENSFNKETPSLGHSSPNLERGVFIEGLSPDVEAARLHDMLQWLAERHELEGPTEVVLLRDRESMQPTGRAIALFPRIANAIRFTRAVGPKFDDMERCLGPLPRSAENEQRGPLVLSLFKDKTLPLEMERQTVLDVLSSAKQLNSSSCEGGSVERQKDERAYISEAPTSVLLLRRLHPDVRAADIAESIERLAHSSGSQEEFLRGILLVSSVASARSNLRNFGFAFFNNIAGAQGALESIRGKSDFAVRPAQLSDGTQSPRRTLVGFASAESAFVEGSQNEQSDDAAIAVGKLLRNKRDTPKIFAEREAKCSVWIAPWAEERVQDASGPTRSMPSKRQSTKAYQSRLAEKKRTASNIANWTKKQGELHGLSTPNSSFEAAQEHDEGNAVAVSEEMSSSAKDATTSQPPSTPPADVPANFFSDRNVMACYLCSRKFKTVELVGRHEKESALHCSNLADPAKRKAGVEALRKAQSCRESVSAKRKTGTEAFGAGFVPIDDELKPCTTDGDDDAPKYRDRALERRKVFGSEAPSKKAKVIRAFEGPAPLPTTVSGVSALSVAPRTREAVSGGEKLDSSNIGNRMLQMMGWIEGQGIGLEGSGRDTPIEAVRYAERAGIGSTGAIKASDSHSGATKSALEQARDERQKRYDAKQSGASS